MKGPTSGLYISTLRIPATHIKYKPKQKKTKKKGGGKRKKKMLASGVSNGSGAIYHGLSSNVSHIFVIKASYACQCCISCISLALLSFVLCLGGGHMHHHIA